MTLKKYFKVNVNKYNQSKEFYIYRPSSLNNPKSNSVMFIQSEYMHMVNSFEKVNECLIYWPNDFEIPKSIMNKNVYIKCKNPHKEYCRFFKENKIENLLKKKKYIFKDGYTYSEDVFLDETSTIFPNVFLSGNIKIGKNVYIGSGSRIIGDVIIGNNVVIKENSVIGADGLTTDRDEDGVAITMPQFGGVIIEDNVQIGANTTIARGAIDDTIIRKGSKIDNNCFISHNCILDENVFIVGESILFGSVHVKRNSQISGNSTIRNGVCIGEYSFVGMGSVVTKDVENNAVVLGNPAKKRKE